ncbi:hypothetical protein D3C85_1741660 [compost metagenome]
MRSSTSFFVGFFVFTDAWSDSSSITNVGMSASRVRIASKSAATFFNIAGTFFTTSNLTLSVCRFFG